MPDVLPSLLDPFSPAEVLCLYADRFMLSFPDRAIGHFAVPTSSRHVDAARLTTLLARCLVGSLVARGRVRLERVECSAWRGGDDVLVRVEPGGDAWPVGSPEQRLLAWLEAQPVEKRELAEGLYRSFVGWSGRPASPGGASGVLARLERTGLTRAVRGRFPWLPAKRPVEVNAAYCQRLSAVSHADVHARVAPSLQALDHHLQGLVDRSCEQAIAVDTNSGTL
mgnify:CR=1 FL=1